MNTRRARAMISIGADSRAMDRELARSKKKLRKFGKDARKAVKGTIGLGKKAVGGILGGGLLGGGLAVASGVGDVVGDIVAFERNLTRLQIASGKSTSEINALRSAITAVSTETGVARDEVLAGASTYVDLTGDIAGAEAAMRSFARISQASGSSVSDVAMATAALQQSMGLKPEDIEAAFSGLIQQGKAGAVSLKDFAGELASLAPRFARFKGGSGVDAIRDMGAAFQVSRQGFGSASEAATGLTALMGAITQNAKKFEKVGVKIFDRDPKTGAKNLRSFHEIVEAIAASKLMKDPTALGKAFGRKEAEQTFMMLQRNLGLYDELVTAGRDAGAVQRDLATYQESAAGKIEKAINGAKIALAEAFTPERIEAFAKALGTAAGWFAKIVGYVEWLIDHMPDEASKDIKQGVEARELAAVGNLTGEERRRALARRALELAEDPGKSGMGIGKLDFGESSEGREGTLAAARALAKEAGILLPQDDPWRGGSSGGDKGLNIPALEAAIARSLEKANITVNVDGGAVAKRIENAPVQRARAGR